MSKADRMGLRHPPMASTEQGGAMVSSVLRKLGMGDGKKTKRIGFESNETGDG